SSDLSAFLWNIILLSWKSICGDQIDPNKDQSDRPGQFFGKSDCSTATLRQGQTFGKMSDGRDGVLYAGVCQLTIITRGIDDHLSGVCVHADLKQSTRTQGGPPP